MLGRRLTREDVNQAFSRANSIQEAFLQQEMARLERELEICDDWQKRLDLNEELKRYRWEHDRQRMQ